MYKIDNNGRFLRFPGITCISPMQRSEISERIIATLDEHDALERYYSRLPQSSWHMTMAALYTQRFEFPKWEQWLSFVDQHLQYFKFFHNWIQRLNSPIGARIVGVTVLPVIQLQLEIDPECVEMIGQAAAELGCHDRLSLPFHMTLAYQYNQAMSEELINTLQENLTEQLVGQSMELSPPRLHYFYDMTEFTPWDGERNPFPTVEIGSKRERFFDPDISPKKPKIDAPAAKSSQRVLSFS